jgi:peptidyl-prolyl cis-trans isomerase D
MFDLHSSKLLAKIIIGVVLGFVSLGMLLYLVPKPNTPLGTSSEGLADVAGQRIDASDVQQQLDLLSQRQQIPQQMRGFYAQQIFDQLLLSRMLDVEAARLGLRVTDQELAHQIQLILPQAFPNGKWVGGQAYSAMVQQELGMTVPDFEDQLRQSILQQKFRDLVTADVTVSSRDVREEFLRRNEKVKIDYALVRPSDLTAKIKPSQSDLEAWYNAHKSQYQVPEKRAANYVMLDLSLLQKNTTIPNAELLAYYNKNIDEYKVPDRVNVQHILFMTIGKTTAEIADIKKKAEMVLEKIQHGADFSKMAKEYSQDPGSKDKGGKLGWILKGQTVPQFQKVAFSLPVGKVSGLVRTQYGFHIIKVLGKETAHTKSFAEVHDQILQAMLTAEVAREERQIFDRMASIVRNSSRQSLSEVVASLGPQVKPDLVIGQIAPVSVTDTIPGMGDSTAVRDTLFSQGIGQLSLPIQTPRGDLILDVSQIVPTHQGTLAEVQTQVTSDYVAAESAKLAQNEAATLAASVKQGKKLDQAAKALGLTAQSADFSRTGNVSGLPAAQLLKAFHAPVGQAEGPQKIGNDWIVYTVSAHEEPSDADFERQKSTIEQELLSDAKDNAFEAFRRALEQRMKREGKLTINEANLKQLTNPSQT